MFHRYLDSYYKTFTVCTNALNFNVYSSSSGLSWSASGLGYRAMVSFHLHEYASMGKWSGSKHWNKAVLFEIGTV